MTDQTNKIAEERYAYLQVDENDCGNEQKYIKNKSKIDKLRTAWASGYTEGLKAGGWVKVESAEQMPFPYHGPMKLVFKDGGETHYEECVRNDPDKFFSRISCSTYDYFYLSETLLPDEQEIAGKALPDVDSCMKYADQEQATQFNNGARKYFSFNYNQFLEFLKYAQTPNREQYLKSIKKD